MSLAWYKHPPEQDAMPGQHWGQKVPWSQGIDSGAAILARMYLLLLQVQSTAAGPDGQEEIRPPPSSRDEGIREARRVITLRVSAAMMAEAGRNHSTKFYCQTHPLRTRGHRRYWFQIAQRTKFLYFMELKKLNLIVIHLNLENPLESYISFLYQLF